MRFLTLLRFVSLILYHQDLDGNLLDESRRVTHQCLDSFLCAHTQDVTHLLTPLFLEKDNEKKLALAAELSANALPREFANLEVP